MIARRTLIVTAALAVLVLGVPSAFGYVIITDNFGDAFAWKKNDVSWYVAANGSKDVPLSEVTSALQAAFNSWQDVDCSYVTFSYGGAVSANPNKDIFLRWLEQNWDLTVQDALGVTTNWQLNPGGGAKKVEIFFNGASYQWTTSGADDPFSNVNDIQAVATHEIGHAIGLTHTRYRQSTMWFTTYPGESEEARSLEPDDKRGVCFLYPAVTFKDGQICDACWNHQNCSTGSCIDFGDEGPHCGIDCNNNGDCPKDYDCLQLQGGVKQCIPFNKHCKNVGANIPVGKFCFDHSTCASGYCLVLPESAVCSTQCVKGGPNNGGCPADMGCVGNSQQGICYPKGNVPIGGACEAPSDCQTILCIGIGQGKGICTQSCTSDSQCPGAMSCINEVCLEKGNAKFGEACESSLDCESVYCPPFLEYCTNQCESDADCPPDIECELGFGGQAQVGYCDAGATGVEGDTCGPGAKECVDGLFCLYKSKEAQLGKCAEKCDARYDGCKGGRYCKWVYQDWFQKVVGVCVDDNGGVNMGEPCGGSILCKPDLVCADTDGQGAKCRQDCNSYNELGCSGSATCIGLNLENNPKLGACHPKDGAPPVENPTVVETVRTAEPPPVEEDLGGTTGGDTGGTDTGGIEPDAGATTTGGGGSGGGREPSGGCATSPGGSGAPLGLAALLLLSVGLLRRKEHVA